jgi:hypothetical protein
LIKLTYSSNPVFRINQKRFPHTLTSKAQKRENGSLLATDNSKTARPSNNVNTLDAMLSKTETKLDFSPLHYQFKLAKNFEEVSFVDLLLKQSNSKRKNLLSQLGLKGMGFICLQHNVEISEQVMKDYTTLLRNSKTKVFRTEDDHSSDPTRKQLLTTYGNVHTSLNAANVNTKHKVLIII